MTPGARLPAVLLAAALAAACAPACAPPADAPQSHIALLPCTLPGLRAAARCGTVRVFEDRPRGAGRTLDLQVVVVPALASSPKPDPVFFLAGGPGQAASQIAAFALGVADRLHESRDFVFVDQRGTGASHALFCEVPAGDAPLADHFDSTFEPDAVERCRDDQDADLRLYSTPIAADDLDDVRAALGYPSINLWGISYGTRMALAYLRAHGDHVRSAVLDSVAPMSLYLPLSLARDADRALDLLFADCAAAPACAAAFPSLRDRFHAFAARLTDEPLHATVKHPVSGRDEVLFLDRDTFFSALRGMLYSAELAALLPRAMERAMDGDLAPFVALAMALGGESERTFATGMFLSVVCAEDIPFFTLADVEREAANTLFGPRSAADIVRACALWPRGDVPAGFRDPVESDRPVLLLSGALDPVTPPSWAEDAKKGLRRSASVVFGGTAHNAAVTACATRLAATFVERASPDDLDTACAAGIPRPPFFTTFAGPP